MKKIGRVFAFLLLFACVYMAVPSRAAETDDLSVDIKNVSHRRCSVQVETSSNEMSGKQVTVYAEDEKGKCLGTTVVTFTAANELCEITFDRIVKAEETVFVYAEKDSGDTSKVRQKRIPACYSGYFQSTDLGPKGMTGKFSTFEDIEGTIEVKISGAVYTGEMDEQGNFEISFGKETYMSGLSATVSVKCCAGCTVSTRNYSVSDQMTYYNTENLAEVYPHYVVCNKTLLKNQIFCIEIDGKRWNSKEHQVTSYHPDYTYLKFDSVQTQGKAATVWVENEVTGQKSKLVSEMVRSQPFKIQENKIKVYRDSLTAYNLRTINYYLSGTQYVPVTLYVSDGISTLEYNVSLYETNCKFPAVKKGGTVLTLWLTDALGASSEKKTVTVPVEEEDNVEYYDEDREDDEDDEEDYEDTLSGYSKIDTIYYGLGKVTGRTLAGTKVTVTIKGKKYTKTIKKKGKFTIKIPVKKIGTKVKIVFSNKEKAKKDYTLNRKIRNKTVEIWHYNLYQNKTSFHGYVKKASKGDKLVITIGGKKYTKKIKSNAKKVNYRFRIKPQRAGSKVTLAVYNKYGQKRRKYKIRVYLSNTVKVGMTKAQVRLTTFGSPTRINRYGNTEQWVYEYSDRTTYLYFRNGKYYSYQEYGK